MGEFYCSSSLTSEVLDRRRLLAYALEHIGIEPSNEWIDPQRTSCRLIIKRSLQHSSSRCRRRRRRRQQLSQTHSLRRSSCVCGAIGVIERERGRLNRTGELISYMSMRRWMYVCANLISVYETKLKRCRSCPLSNTFSDCKAKQRRRRRRRRRTDAITRLKDTYTHSNR